MKLKQFNILFSISAIIVLLVDVNFTNEFRIESKFLALCILLIIINLIRLLFLGKFEKYKPFTLVNITLCLILMYSIPIQTILVWGVGFTGRDFPLIIGVVLFVSLGFIIILVADTMKLFFDK